MIDKKLVIDNIQGSIECIKTLRGEIKHFAKKEYPPLLDSLINGNIILLTQTKHYLREELK
jgi:hypothetical protein